jgi:hypothetical protein
MLQHLDICHIGQSKIGNYEVERALTGELQPFLTRAGQGDAEAGSLQSSADRSECGAVLVDDEDRGHVSLGFRRRS